MRLFLETYFLGLKIVTILFYSVRQHSKLFYRTQKLSITNPKNLQFIPLTNCNNSGKFPNNNIETHFFKNSKTPILAQRFLTLRRTIHLRVIRQIDKKFFVGFKRLSLNKNSNFLFDLINFFLKGTEK